jgi:hypothetical protein
MHLCWYVNGYVVLREKTASRNKENWQFSDPLRPGIQEAQVSCTYRIAHFAVLKQVTVFNTTLLGNTDSPLVLCWLSAVWHTM